MKILIHTLFLIFTPVFTHEKPILTLPIVPQVRSPALIDVSSLARMMQAESIGEGETGMRWAADVAKNRAANSCNPLAKELEKGFCLSDSLKPEIFELAKIIIGEPVLHPYTYFLNPRKATDKAFLKWAKTRTGVFKKNHFFFK
jgi:hypothetical protein